MMLRSNELNLSQWRPIWFSLRAFLPWLVCFGLLSSDCVLGQKSGKVEIDFVDKDTQHPLECRVKILDGRGRPQRARGALFHNGWNLIQSPLVFNGGIGEYTYQAFHGPRYSPSAGGFTIFEEGQGVDIVRLPNHCNLKREGWFGGDLLSLTSASKTEQWLAAEDLQMSAIASGKIVPEIAETSELAKQEPFGWVEESSYRDIRTGSGLTFHHWMPPAEVPRDLPSSRLIVLAKNAEPAALPVHVEIQRLWARDVPIWLASNRIDSVQVISEHLDHEGKKETKFEVLVDPEPGRFRGKLGPGRMLEFIYWQILEAGLEIPPSAGSGFGRRSNNPLGYNRVYTKPAELTVKSWWEALAAGNSFITNGPLLRVRVNDQAPGATFESREGVALQADVALTLTVGDPVQYLDVIFNGQTIYQARLDEYAKQGGRIPVLPINESGWMVVRVLTEVDQTYRFASTAPYYFKVGGAKRVSRKAVEFFQSWLQEAKEQIESAGQAQNQAPYVQAATRFWDERLEQATAP